MSVFGPSGAPMRSLLTCAGISETTNHPDRVTGSGRKDNRRFQFGERCPPAGKASAVVARSPDRATPPTEGLPIAPTPAEETFGQAPWHGQETVPQQCGPACGLALGLLTRKRGRGEKDAISDTYRGFDRSHATRYCDKRPLPPPTVAGSCRRPAAP